MFGDKCPQLRLPTNYPIWVLAAVRLRPRTYNHGQWSGLKNVNRVTEAYQYQNSQRSAAEIPGAVPSR